MTSGRRWPAWLVQSSCLLVLLVSRTEAEPPTVKAAWPASLTATIGDVRVRIDGPKMWTLSRIEYGGAVMGIEDSAYGTVVNIRNVGFIGTAHKEVEPENVTELKFIVDDRLLDLSANQSHVKGKSFRLRRESRIRALALESDLQVNEDRILQSVRITSDAAVDLKVIYPLMYAWTPTAAEFLFGADDGQETGGEFLPKALEQPRYIIEKRSVGRRFTIPCRVKGRSRTPFACPTKWTDGSRSSTHPVFTANCTW